MPKLIDYPRTNYAGAWEIADIVDDTGGKCALETCARKLDRKVSGSFKAIVGSAVKFGLLTSKREMLTTTTLFRRIKHAYDKQEEILFHREAFLTPPLFTQLCRKFRGRELPVQMLDIMLIREFDVEEINAQSVAKAFVEGARMVGLLNEHNTIADIDLLAAQQPPRKELSSPDLSPNSFRSTPEANRPTIAARDNEAYQDNSHPLSGAVAQNPIYEEVKVPELWFSSRNNASPPQLNQSTHKEPLLGGTDAIANLFGLDNTSAPNSAQSSVKSRPAPAPQPTAASTTDVTNHTGANYATQDKLRSTTKAEKSNDVTSPVSRIGNKPTGQEYQMTKLSEGAVQGAPTLPNGFRIELSGPGLNINLDVQDEDDLILARALLEKVGRQLKK